MSTVTVKNKIDKPEKPDAGYVKIYMRNGSLRALKANGSESTFADGVTREFVEDLLQSSFADTDTIEWVYDDATNQFEASLKLSALSDLIQSITDHKNNSNNPHNVNKDDVQLGNVPNLDTRARSTHTGVQLASTISDLNQAFANYLDRKHYEEVPIYQHTSNNYDWMISQNISFNHPNKKYKVVVSYECSSNHTGSDFRSIIVIGGIQLYYHSEECKDANNQSLIRSFTGYYIPTSTAPVNARLEFKGEQNGRQMRMGNAQIFIERWQA